MQSKSKIVLSLSLAAGLGYVVGTTEVLHLPFAVATIQPDENEMPAEMMEGMEAWMKASEVTEHHTHLDMLNGDWDVDVKFWMAPGAEAMTSTGTVSREWVLGGRFLKEEVTASSMTGEEFEAVGYSGWNNVDGRYEFIWLENMSTAIMMEHGSYNAEEKKFFNYGSHRDPMTGHMIASWGELDVSDPDRHTMTGWKVGADGVEHKSFEGVFERK